MLLKLLYLVLLCFFTLAFSSSVPPFYKTKAGCDAKCGSMLVPYPFGIINSNGNNCSIGGTAFDYGITCNTSSDPPKSFLGTSNVEVIDISETEIRIKVGPASICYNESGNASLATSVMSMEFVQTQFRLSYTKNMFFGIGCNVIVSIFSDLNNYTSSCSSRCTSRESIQDGFCFDKGCCQMTMPKGLTNFTMSLSLHGSEYGSVTASFDPCSYAFIAELDRYTFNASDILDGKHFISEGKNLPIVFDWAIGNKTCEEAKEDLANFACHENSYCVNPDNNPGYHCTCNNGYEGNPYLSPGCQ
ncbi:hypothetical protein MKW92_043587, partial [Papaver armeniacum]